MPTNNNVNNENNENNDLEPSKEIPQLFNLKNFGTWANAKSEILKAWPDNKTILTLMGKISAKILLGTQPEVVIIKDLRDICEIVSQSGIKNPAGLFNTKCHAYFDLNKHQKQAFQPG